MAKGAKEAAKQGTKKAQRQKGAKPVAAPKQGAKKAQQQKGAKEGAKQGAKKAQQDADKEPKAPTTAPTAPSTDRYMCKTWFMKDRPSWP